MLAASILFWADIYCSLNFLTERDRIVASQGLNDDYEVECGIIFVSFYILYFLPAVKTVLDVSQIINWTGVVFNIGCLVELKLGPLRKTVDALEGMLLAFLIRRMV